MDHDSVQPMMAAARSDDEMRRPLLVGTIFKIEAALLLVTTLATRLFVELSGGGSTAVACDRGWGALVPYFRGHAATYCDQDAARVAVAVYFLFNLAMILIGTLLLRTRAYQQSFRPEGFRTSDLRLAHPRLGKFGFLLLGLAGAAIWLVGADSRGMDLHVFDNDGWGFVMSMVVLLLILIVQFILTQADRGPEAVILLDQSQSPRRVIERIKAERAARK